MLKYNVVKAKVKAKEAAGLTEADRVVGKSNRITSKGDSLMISNANAVKADVVASNGVIHVIDEVLIPN